MKKSAARDDVNMSPSWPQQVAHQDAQAASRPMLQLVANQHQLATSMNTDNAATAVASKSSLAFILGGNVDEDRTYSTGVSFANLSVASSVLVTEDLANNVSHPARIKVTVKKSRICKFHNCTRYVVNRGLCIGHGGGKRCAILGCTSSAKNLGLCWKHGKGGSTKCTVIGCDNRAKSRGVCWSHGGGRKCSEDSCAKTAVSHGLCWAHGGGKRCVIDGCRKPAYERNGNMCSLHQATNADASQKPATR